MKAKTLFAFLAAFGMVAMLVSIPAVQAAPAPQKLTFGIVVKTEVNDPFQVTMATTAQKEAQKLGATALVEAPPSNSDVQAQQAIVEDLIQRKVNGILLAPVDTQAMKASMAEAAKAGIPVVLFDSNPIAGAQFVTAIGTDNKKAAAIAADYLIKKFDGKAKVAQLEGQPGDQNALYRAQGFANELKTAPGMQLVADQTGHWTTAGAEAAMENILTAHPDLQAVFAASDEMGLGAVQAIKAAGKIGKITIVTFDGLPDGVKLIEQGISDGDVAQFPTKMGTMGIDILDQIATGQKKASDFPSYIDSGAELVTPQLASTYLQQTFGIAPAQPEKGVSAPAGTPSK